MLSHNSGLGLLCRQVGWDGLGLATRGRGRLTLLLHSVRQSFCLGTRGCHKDPVAELLSRALSISFLTTHEVALPSLQIEGDPTFLFGRPCGTPLLLTAFLITEVYSMALLTVC
jgi:hypothetical protein